MPFTEQYRLTGVRITSSTDGRNDSYTFEIGHNNATIFKTLAEAEDVLRRARGRGTGLFTIQKEYFVTGDGSFDSLSDELNIDNIGIG